MRHVGGLSISIGWQSEVESVRSLILGINGEVYPDTDHWEQDQASVDKTPGFA